ncbi:hypothetical protein QQG55_9515 [Brugia pahangi]|uniref:Arrestin_N domain-containing protein n=1 Tax=Brugia pahangi TaxID=6280 RepID=A0A0N4T931_BRUPA|nr:unnamed protein product [Brugia pahangi]
MLELKKSDEEDLVRNWQKCAAGKMIVKEGQLDYKWTIRPNDPSSFEESFSNGISPNDIRPTDQFSIKLRLSMQLPKIFDQRLEMYVYVQNNAREMDNNNAREVNSSKQ